MPSVTDGGAFASVNVEGSGVPTATSSSIVINERPLPERDTMAARTRWLSIGHRSTITMARCPPPANLWTMPLIVSALESDRIGVHHEVAEEVAGLLLVDRGPKGFKCQPRLANPGGSDDSERASRRHGR